MRICRNFNFQMHTPTGVFKSQRLQFDRPRPSLSRVECYAIDGLADELSVTLFFMVVFIVDDDAGLLSVLIRASRTAGFTTIGCKNGQELLDALHVHRTETCLVILDIHMSGKDGIEMIDDLVPYQDNLRVRFMTGGPDYHVIAASMIARSRGLNVGRSIFKPFEIKTFLDFLHADRAALESAASRSE